MRFGPWHASEVTDNRYLDGSFPVVPHALGKRNTDVRAFLLPVHILSLSRSGLPDRLATHASDKETIIEKRGFG